MRKTLYSLLMLLLLAGTFLAGSWHNQQAAARNGTPGARKILYYVDPMHPTYKSDKPGIAPDCGMELVPVYEDGSMGGGEGAVTGPPGTVNISPDKQQLLGVRVSPVEKAAGTHALRLLGRVVPDEKKLYRLKAPVDGWIREVSSVTTGDRVAKDQWLAAYSTTDLFVSAQGMIFALTSMDRLAKDSPESSAQINPTNSNFQQRIERLQSLGMSPIQIEEIRRTRIIPPSIKIFAPAVGFVLARNVSPEEKFEKGAEWYRIADLSQVWIMADVFQNEAHYLRPGVRAQVSVPGQTRTFPARVAEVLSQFDPATRTLKVRLEADNPGFALRPDMFVDVELPISLPPTIAIPVDAVVDSGLKKTVYVDRGEGIFEPRQVETGWRLGDRVEIVQGLKTGERIVVSGAFLLDSESQMKLAAAGATGPMQAAQWDHGRWTMDDGPAAGATGHRHATHMQPATIAAASAMTPVARAFAPAKDPICGMEVDAEKAKIAGWVSEYNGKTYYFCSDDCKQQFDKDPARHALRPAPDSDPGTAPTGEAHLTHDHGGHQ